VLTDCVHVIIFINIIYKLGSTIGAQHVYCQKRTAFLYSQFNFAFQRGQLNRYKGNFWTFLQVFIIILQYQKNTLKTYTFARIHSSFIHSNLSIAIMHIRFQYNTDHLYVAHLIALISPLGCAAPCKRIVSEQ
jgi:hypothetical protein